MKIQHIVCPTDLSEGAKEALRNAKSLAADYKANLVILYVIPELSSLVHGFYQNDDEMEKIYKGIEKEVRVELDEQVGDVGGIENMKKVIAIGDPAQEIVRVAEECKADLIIMGTHGRSGIDHMLFGSTTEKVVRKATCPVMTVKVQPSNV